jgi:hypothetical protein
VIRNVFRAASYTYGPLLGLYTFGFFTRKQVNDKWVWLVCVLSPIACYLLNDFIPVWTHGYKFGFELLILNGLLTFAGLAIISKKAVPSLQPGT